jgi:hypothetical protein
MNNHKQTLLEAVLARISLGAVPMDGIYWFDPKAIKAKTIKAGTRHECSARDAGSTTPTNSETQEGPCGPAVPAAHR